MTENERSAARMALPMLQNGILLDDVRNSIRQRLPFASEQEILSGTGMAFNSVTYALEAMSDQYRQFGDVPFSEEFTYNIRVRLFYDTRSGGRGMAGTMDVIATAADSIEAIKDYARAQVRAIRNREDTIPGGGGDSGGSIDPDVTITAIFNADDSFSVAKKTVNA